ncbi:hypothetical protein LTS18_002860, partial [Coniosporium uncinatum]
VFSNAEYTRYGEYMEQIADDLGVRCRAFPLSEPVAALYGRLSQHYVWTYLEKLGVPQTDGSVVALADFGHRTLDLAIAEIVDRTNGEYIIHDCRGFEIGSGEIDDEALEVARRALNREEPETAFRKISNKTRAMVWCSQSFECDIKRRMHKTFDGEHISGVEIDMAAIRQKAKMVYQTAARNITQKVAWKLPTATKAQSEYALPSLER